MGERIIFNMGDMAVWVVGAGQPLGTHDVDITDDLIDLINERLGEVETVSQLSAEAERLRERVFLLEQDNETQLEACKRLVEENAQLRELLKVYEDEAEAEEARQVAQLERDAEDMARALRVDAEAKARMAKVRPVQVFEGEIEHMSGPVVEAALASIDGREPAVIETFDPEEVEAGALVRRCRVCGCTETTACVHPEAGPCWWVGPDLCSHCSIVGPHATDGKRLELPEPAPETGGGVVDKSSEPNKGGRPAPEGREAALEIIRDNWPKGASPDFILGEIKKVCPAYGDWDAKRLTAEASKLKVKRPSWYRFRAPEKGPPPVSPVGEPLRTPKAPPEPSEVLTPQSSQGDIKDDVSPPVTTRQPRVLKRPTADEINRGLPYPPVFVGSFEDVPKSNVIVGAPGGLTNASTGKLTTLGLSREERREALLKLSHKPVEPVRAPKDKKLTYLAATYGKELQAIMDGHVTHEQAAMRINARHGLELGDQISPAQVRRILEEMEGQGNG